MRILAVIESPSWIEHHIVGSLEDMGHEVCRFAYGEFVGEFYGRSRQQERLKKNNELLELARRMRANDGLDLIFCYVYDDFLTVEHVSALAALGVPMVNLNVDMINQWYRQIRTARFFTAVLCAQTKHMDQIACYGGRAYYFPMAARPPSQHCLVSSSDFIPAAPVTFLGTPMTHRLRVLSFLERANVPIAVYGKYWTEDRHVAPEHSIEKTLSDIRHYAWARLRAEGPAGLLQPLMTRLKNWHRASETPVLTDAKKQGVLRDDEVFALFRRSKINLGFTRMVGDDPNKTGQNQVKLRDFEVPLAGGFYLVERAPDYDKLFTPGVEVETWKTPDELLSKIRYYLTHESERAAIAAAGERRARSEHTWAHRFGALFAKLGLSRTC